MPTFTSVSVTNAALEMIGQQAQITSLSDGTPSANAATVIYQPVVQLLLRELDPDFARFTAALVVSGAVTPVAPWAYEYLYPTDCVRLRQVRPLAGSYDRNDPQPILSQVAFDVIATVNTKVILTNQVTASAVYTSLTPTESQWDAGFAEAVSRRLANPLAMALAGRPDFARELLEESVRMAGMAEAMDDGALSPQ